MNNTFISGQLGSIALLPKKLSCEPHTCFCENFFGMRIATHMFYLRKKLGEKSRNLTVRPLQFVFDPDPFF